MEYKSLRAVHKRRRNRAAAPIGALVLVLAYGVVCGLVALGCWKGVRELLELVEQLPEVYTGTLGPALRARSEEHTSELQSP